MTTNLLISKADKLFATNIKRIMNKEGVFSEQARPKYKDGTTANSKYITGVCDTYDLTQNEFPITQLRPIPIQSAIKEIFWIYQDQTNSLDVLENKYNVHYWNDWEIPNVPANDGTSRSIGKRYGAIVKEKDIINKILKQLKDNPWNRRNVISLWDYDAFEETDGLYPCAFQVMFDVRRIDGEIYLDATLTQRSNDMLVAHHINAIQYVALQMMIACHFGWKVGKFIYFINNLHIYDNQFSQAKELIKRYNQTFTNNFNTNYRKMLTPTTQKDIRNLKSPILKLNCPPKTNFYDIKPEDFEIINYNPLTPQLKFDLAI